MVIAFSGKIGSGKSTVATALAQTLGLPQVSFGDYVRQQAQLRQLPQTRQQLQDLGEHLLQTDASAFCREVLGQAPNWPQGVVVDGVRHQDVLQLLRQLVVPQSLFHIHLTLDEATRTQRVEQRSDGLLAHGQEQYRTGTHPTEQQVTEALPRVADIVVNSSVSLPEIIAKIKGSLLKNSWISTGSSG
jgi:cytidylate kinase